MQLDRLDLKLLAELQKDGRLTNNDLSERIGLSASQCSRRRARLEDDKVIRGYRADIDRQKMAVDLNVGTQIGHNDLGFFFGIHSVNSVPILPPIQSIFWCVIRRGGRDVCRLIYSRSSQNLS